MLRPYVPPDAEAIAAVYRDAVVTLGPQAYTPEQIEAWAKYPEDMEELRERLARGATLVAEANGRIVAFGQLEPDDHLAFIYCSGAAARQGISSAIYRALEAHAIRKGVAEIHTEASRLGRPFFARHGFTLIEPEYVVRAGIEFERFKMSKRIADPKPAP